jgi:MFS family permease
MFFMIESFDVVQRQADVAFYLGVIWTVLFASQSLTNPFWGWLSDRIGRRKPILLIGTFGAMVGFFLFGFSETFAWVEILYFTNFWQSVCKFW